MSWSCADYLLNRAFVTRSVSVTYEIALHVPHIDIMYLCGVLHTSAHK